MSPDHSYVIDRVPGTKNMWMAGCMSGTGFKNGPAIGRALTQTMKGERPCVDLAPFSLARFSAEKTKTNNSKL